MDRILVTGSSGLIGTALKLRLQKRAMVTSLVRNAAQPARGELLWNPYAPQPILDSGALASMEGIAAGVHLSGANVAGHRWSERYKGEILRSRREPTSTLARMLAQLKEKPKVLVSASAVGIYGDMGGKVLTESSPAGSNFLAGICQAWEAATQPAREAGIRVVHLRFGVVLSRHGGALAKMLPPFRLGLGARLGDGKQWVSWVSLQDAVRAIEFALDTASLSDAVNVVSPSPVTNADFTRTLGRILHRPAFLTAPAFALKLALGEMAEETVLASQRAVPERLQAEGFCFEHPVLADALKSELG